MKIYTEFNYKTNIKLIDSSICETILKINR